MKTRYRATLLLVATILLATAAGFTQPAYAGVTFNLQAALQQLNLSPGSYTSPTVLDSVGLMFVPNAASTPGAAGTGTLYVVSAALDPNAVHPPGTMTEAFFFGPGIAYNVLNCTTLAWTGAGSLTAFTITRPGMINNASIPAWAMYAYAADGTLLSSTGEGNLTTGSFPLTNGHYADFTVSSSTPITQVVFCSHNGFSTYNALPLSGATTTASEQPPVVGAISAPGAPVALGTSITASASFTDPNSLDTHTATWNWGDGSTTVGTVTEAGGNGSVSNTHTYAAAGVYTITLSVTDNAGGVGTSTFEFVVIYDPNGGFVTGGGWITSPTGTFPANPALVGRANFGFVSKYQKGATVPTGNTQFQFQVADLDFHSTSYDWLVISGARAQYKGTGTINGIGNYGFLLTAIDGEVSGGGGTDKFRIKIWDKNNNDTVVYDNQLGASDTADPTTVIGGGDIVIHSK